MVQTHFFLYLYLHVVRDNRIIRVLALVRLDRKLAVEVVVAAHNDNDELGKMIPSVFACLLCVSTITSRRRKPMFSRLRKVGECRGLLCVCDDGSSDFFMRSADWMMEDGVWDFSFPKKKNKGKLIIVRRRHTERWPIC